MIQPIQIKLSTEEANRDAIVIDSGSRRGTICGYVRYVNSQWHVTGEYAGSSFHTADFSAALNYAMGVAYMTFARLETPKVGA